MRILAAISASILLISGAMASDKGSDFKGPIQDNSFLVEEAYNQEDGVIQHISFVQILRDGDFLYTQTDEWPLRSLKHQLSVTGTIVRSTTFLETGPGLGDAALNYRYQFAGSGDSRIAIAPRVSLLLPTGSAGAGRGFGGPGVQTNFPVSIVHGRHLVTHWNAGVTFIPSARDAFHNRATLLSPNLGQSTVLLINPRLNALCEVVWSSNAAVAGPGTTFRSQNVLINPGVRWAYNFKSGLQIVPGVGLPFGVGPSAGQKGVIFYLSFEHPYDKAHSR